VRYIADAPDFLGADRRQRRFEYVASDTETIFRDLVDPEPRSRRVFGNDSRTAHWDFLTNLTNLTNLSNGAILSNDEKGWYHIQTHASAWATPG
jgi:hypothetical protein